MHLLWWAAVSWKTDVPRMGARESSQDVLAGHHSRNRICISSFTGSCLFLDLLLLFICVWLLHHVSMRFLVTYSFSSIFMSCDEFHWFHWISWSNSSVIRDSEISTFMLTSTDCTSPSSQHMSMVNLGGEGLITRCSTTTQSDMCHVWVQNNRKARRHKNRASHLCRYSKLMSAVQITPILMQMTC